MPWTGMIQTVESNYGSAVATYFKLMRSLLLATFLAGELATVYSAVCLTQQANQLFFVAVPQAVLFPAHHNTSFGIAE